jgi:hypothetical protein
VPVVLVVGYQQCAGSAITINIYFSNTAHSGYHFTGAVGADTLVGFAGSYCITLVSMFKHDIAFAKVGLIENEGIRFIARLQENDVVYVNQLFTLAGGYKYLAKGAGGFFLALENGRVLVVGEAVIYPGFGTGNKAAGNKEKKSGRSDCFFHVGFFLR